LKSGQNELSQWSEVCLRRAAYRCGAVECPSSLQPVCVEDEGAAHRKGAYK
jgi:hypothetical protein